MNLRLDGKTALVTGSTGGIGLAISQQLANHLGAELSLKCSSSNGCTFRLVLPRPGSPTERRAEAAAHALDKILLEVLGRLAPILGY